ncbi:MAG TPA: di-heme oxidoredictase family protein [Candidatus Krumholzibacteria bacterium]|nr:di-heme oxidoredictase family protein [Candidatus Krumholzibacteria bacterium]
MRTLVALTALVVSSTALFRACARVPSPGDPIDGLTRAERERFDRGRVTFERVFEPETGLGPLFNAESCVECHESPAVGGAGDEVEVHVSAFAPDGSFCDPLVHQGGPVVQQRVTPALRAALGIESEPVPADAERALRTAPDVLGFGLLDAVPDSTILALADPNDSDQDGISGRPNRFFDGRLGRFGRKALVPTLREFNAGALVIEQGITNPLVPTEETIGGAPIPDGVDPVEEPEVDQEAVDRLDDFVRFLAPPSPRPLTKAAKRGKEVFFEVGCQSCHAPVLVTGNHPVKALRYRKVAAYTDLLLHDMGPELADICFGEATPSEFRTEPLMGLRFSEQIAQGKPRFLHDGRAQTIEEAVRLHGGEATAARDRFVSLSEADRAALLAFLRSL